MKILIAGSTGGLGSECRVVLDQEHEIINPIRKKLDITSWDGVIECLHGVRPGVVLNCVGFTDMQACETEDFSVRKINVEGPRNLAQCSARFECVLVHISCDHVFDGQKMMPQPYFEDDTTSPLSAYGRSKVESELAVRGNAPDYIIVRSGWLYGLNRENFIKSIVTKALQKKQKPIRVPHDQYGSPTWTHRLALQIKELIEKNARGTYHVTAEGYCSRFECATYVLDKLGIKATLEPCSIRDQEGPRSPANCLLENRLAKKQGISIMPNWKGDLDIFLDQYGKELIKEARTKKA
ncbi:MAG: NAD(P)-dependent oxidoreductase [Pseudomonadota bacterium]